jgi:hypothetical protein
MPLDAFVVMTKKFCQNSRKRDYSVNQDKISVNSNKPI